MCNVNDEINPNDGKEPHFIRYANIKCVDGYKTNGGADAGGCLLVKRLNEYGTIL